MAICEADPWRLQYFDGIPCPDNVDVPTEDADAWTWFPAHRWVYDKLAVAQSQGIAAAPHGVMPPAFPVFSKPIINLRGMGTGSRVIASAGEYRPTLTPGTFLDGTAGGRTPQQRCRGGERPRGVVAPRDRHPAARAARSTAGSCTPSRCPQLEAACGAWIAPIWRTTREC